jgi:alpha-tubulin suppressor-like RCC1 family protein
MRTSLRMSAVMLALAAAAPAARGDKVPLSDVVMVDGGQGYGVALKSDGTVLAWGDNSSGQLGDGTNQSSFAPVQVMGLGPGSGVIAVSAGYLHALALKADGTVLAWGENLLGQLGDGTTAPRNSPAQVMGLSGDSKVVAIAAGFTHSVAVKADGSVWCWGRNGLGGCGIGALVPNAVTMPVQVHGVDNEGFLDGVEAISAGANTTMALTRDGELYLWGNNNNGQLGNGMVSTSPQVTPIKVMDGVIAIANASIMGATSSYAVKSDGAVLAWGSNTVGQLGDGTTDRRPSPTPVSGLGVGSGVVELAAGLSHVLARKSDGTVLAWGNNSNGQLGVGTIEGSKVPGAVTGISGVKAVAGGDLHSYALTSDGKVWAWGNYASGQLGEGHAVVQASPVQVVGLGTGSGVAAVSAGGGFALALKGDGSVVAWGANGSGQLGDNSTTNREAPVGVATLGAGSGVKAISAGRDHALAVMEDGSVLSWGGNGNGQLGTNDTMGRRTPGPVAGLGAGSGVVAAVAGPARSMALKSDGTVWTWGGNGQGTAGDGTTMQRLSPVQVHGVGDEGFLTGVTAIASNHWASYALRSTGEVLAWGYNGVAAIGDGSRDNRLLPTLVSGLASGSGVKVLATYFSGGLVAKEDGTVLGWAANIGGPIGDGTSMLRLVPVQASGLGAGSGVIALAGGTAHTLALRSDGSILVWGANSSGQLGDGTTMPRLTPTPAASLAQVQQVSAFPGDGGNFSLALLGDGKVLAWGGNNSSQLGDGSVYTQNRTPGLVVYEAAVMGPAPDAGVPALPDAGSGTADARVPPKEIGDGGGCGCRVGSDGARGGSARGIWLGLVGVAIWQRARGRRGKLRFSGSRP